MPIFTNGAHTSTPSFLTDHEWDQIGAVLKLSPRERQILYGILNNQAEVVVAEQLSVSVHTVHTHTKRLYAKLEAASRSSAVVRIFAVYAALTKNGRNALPQAVPRAGDTPTGVTRKCDLLADG
jgi:DNA-binding CsgD family transcriptional regulator